MHKIQVEALPFHVLAVSRGGALSSYSLELQPQEVSQSTGSWTSSMEVNVGKKRALGFAASHFSAQVDSAFTREVPVPRQPYFHL